MSDLLDPRMILQFAMCCNSLLYFFQVMYRIKLGDMKAEVWIKP